MLSRVNTPGKPLFARSWHTSGSHDTISRPVDLRHDPVDGLRPGRGLGGEFGVDRSMVARQSLRRWAVAGKIEREHAETGNQQNRGQQHGRPPTPPAGTTPVPRRPGPRGRPAADQAAAARRRPRRRGRGTRWASRLLIRGRSGGHRRHRSHEPRSGGYQLAENAAGRRPGGWILSEAAIDQPAQRFGEPAHIRLGMKYGECRGGQRLAPEGQLTGAGEHHRHGPRPHVGRCGHPGPGQLLGSHERRSSHGGLARKARGGHPGNDRQPEVDHHRPVGTEQDIAGLEVAMHHPGGMHRAQRGQRCDRDALQRSAAARPVLLDDLYQRRPVDVFADNERPTFEDPRIQNLRGAEPGDPLRRGDLFQEAATDLWVRGRRQKLDRRRVSGGALRQVHNALTAFPEASEQPVYAHLARIRVAQGKHLRHRGPGGRHLAILPPESLCAPQ